MEKHRKKTGLNSGYPCLICDFRRRLLKFQTINASGGEVSASYESLGYSDYQYNSHSVFLCPACGFEIRPNKKWDGTIEDGFTWIALGKCKICKDEEAAFSSQISGLNLIKVLLKGVCDDCLEHIEDKDECEICKIPWNPKFKHMVSIEEIERGRLFGIKYKNDHWIRDMCEKCLNKHKNGKMFEFTDNEGKKRTLRITEEEDG